MQPVLGRRAAAVPAPRRVRQAGAGARRARLLGLRAADVGRHAVRRSRCTSPAWRPSARACPTISSGSGAASCSLARTLAPKAVVGFHASRWAGTPAQMVAFLNGIGAGEADVIVQDMLDRDAGCFEAHTDPDCQRNDGPWYWDETNQTRPNFHEYLDWAKAISDGLGKPMLWWQVPFGVPSATPGGTRRPLPRQPRALHLQPHRRVRRGGRPRRHVRHRRRQPDVHHHRRRPVQERGHRVLRRARGAALAAKKRGGGAALRGARGPSGQSPRPDAASMWPRRARVDERGAPGDSERARPLRRHVRIVAAGDHGRGEGEARQRHRREAARLGGGVCSSESTSAGATSRGPRGDRAAGGGEQRVGVRHQHAAEAVCGDRHRLTRRRRPSAVSSAASQGFQVGMIPALLRNARAARQTRAPSASASARVPTRPGRG